MLNIYLYETIRGTRCISYFINENQSVSFVYIRVLLFAVQAFGASSSTTPVTCAENYTTMLIVLAERLAQILEWLKTVAGYSKFFNNDHWDDGQLFLL